MAQIYRVGKNIFDASTNQRIANPTVLATQYKGATEIKAPSIPAGATKISGPSGLQGLNESQLFRQGQDVYKLPPIATTLNSDQLTGANHNIPSLTPAESTANSFVAGIGAGTAAADLYTAQEVQRAGEITQKTEAQKRVDDLITQKGGQGAALKAAYAEAGVPESEKQRANIRIQREQAKAKYDTMIADNKLRVASAGSIYGREALMRDKQAVEYGNLAALEQTLTGNITAAKATAKEAVDLEYEAIDNQLELQLQQLSNVYNDLSANDKKRADELALVLGKQKDDIATAKETKKNIADLMISVGEAGQADAETLKKILNAKSYEEAAALAAPYLGDKGTWEESDVTDANGNAMLFNKSTGEYKTVTGSDATASFSDANGDSWNISGWATDQTKANQMQSIANKIGKVDDSNIEEKVKQFTPGLTADMIKQASANSGVSWEALMTMVNQESTGGISNVAKNNNNFGGLTWSANTQWKEAPYNGTIGTARPEGGNYIKFPTKQAGLNAMADLMAQYGKVETSSSDNNKQALSLILGSGKFTKDQEKAVTKAINEGQDPVTVIKNQAKNIMGQTLATDLDKYEVAREQLSSIKNLLGQYYKDGGKTNIFTGNYEKTINKLGEVKDPKLVEIATNIAAALQIYRNAVSGTAYSVQEGKDIASIFPGINKSEGLNDAILKGRMSAFQSTIDAKYRNTLGEVYDKLKPVEKTEEKPKEQPKTEAAAFVDEFERKNGIVTEQPEEKKENVFTKLFNKLFK